MITWRPDQDTWYIPNHGDVRMGTAFIDDQGDIFVILKPVKAGWSMLQGFDVYLNGKKRFMPIQHLKHYSRILSNEFSLPSSSEL